MLLQIPVALLVGFNILLFGAIALLVLLLIIVIYYYLNSSLQLYFKKVSFNIEDLTITYWYKRDFLVGRETQYLHRKVIIYNNKTDKKETYKLLSNPWPENRVYFYQDEPFVDQNGNLNYVFVIRDSIISMCFDMETLEYLGNDYVFRNDREKARYFGKIKSHEFIESTGSYESIKSSEFNYGEVEDPKI